VLLPKNQLKLYSEMTNKLRTFNLLVYLKQKLLSFGNQSHLQVYSVMIKICLQIYSEVKKVQVFQHQFNQYPEKINNLKLYFSLINQQDKISQKVVGYSVDSTKVAKDFRINSVKAFHNK